MNRPILKKILVALTATSSLFLIGCNNNSPSDTLFRYWNEVEEGSLEGAKQQFADGPITTPSLISVVASMHQVYKNEMFEVIEKTIKEEKMINDNIILVQAEKKIGLRHDGEFKTITVEYQVALMKEDEKWKIVELRRDAGELFGSSRVVVTK